MDQRCSIDVIAEAHASHSRKNSQSYKLTADHKFKLQRAQANNNFSFLCPILLSPFILLSVRYSNSRTIVLEVINKMSNEHTNLNETDHPNQDEAAAPAPSDSLSAEPPVTDATATESANEPMNESGSALAEMSPVSMQPAIELDEAKRGLEAALLAASEPMPLHELKKIFDGELSADILRNLLDELRTEWADRSVELAVVASGYRFRVKPDYQKYIDRLANDKPPKYSRAVLETMAIIAYRQPVTRSDIEDIRGVAVSPHILKTLEDRGWIDEIGHKDAPGRPALFATTKHFLDDLNLISLDELPPLHELQATLDMSQAGAVLNAGSEIFALPGIAAGIEVNADGTGETTAQSPDSTALADDEMNPKTDHDADEMVELVHSVARDAPHFNEQTIERSTHDAPQLMNEETEANEKSSNEEAGAPHEKHSSTSGESL